MQAAHGVTDAAAHTNAVARDVASSRDRREAQRKLWAVWHRLEVSTWAMRLARALVCMYFLNLCWDDIETYRCGPGTSTLSIDSNAVWVPLHDMKESGSEQLLPRQEVRKYVRTTCACSANLPAIISIRLMLSSAGQTTLILRMRKHPLCMHRQTRTPEFLRRAKRFPQHYKSTRFPWLEAFVLTPCAILAALGIKVPWTATALVSHDNNQLRRRSDMSS